jgi:hypothetical protein
MVNNTLLTIISDWVSANKKSFWKYEVSSYYETYKISIANLPVPSNEDIMLKSYKQFLNKDQKTQLCNKIKKAYAKTDKLRSSSIDVKIDYVKGVVIAAVI